jgi:DUF971 family protein
MRPAHIEIINNTLAIVWEDGSETFLEGAPLRRACPCAACKGEANVLSHAAPRPQNYQPASFEIRRWEYIGGYALQPHWGDGHGSGIYPFDYLRQLGANTET